MVPKDVLVPLYALRETETENEVGFSRYCMLSNVLMKSPISNLFREIGFAMFQPDVSVVMIIQD